MYQSFNRIRKLLTENLTVLNNYHHKSFLLRMLSETQSSWTLINVNSECTHHTELKYMWMKFKLYGVFQVIWSCLLSCYWCLVLLLSLSHWLGSASISGSSTCYLESGKLMSTAKSSSEFTQILTRTPFFLYWISWQL